MSRWQTILLIFYPPLRPGNAADVTVLEMREGFRAFGATQIIDPDARVTEVVIGGVDCVIVEARDVRATMLYMHGGGFRVGEPATYIGLASGLAIRAGLRIVLAAYRLAPEHPFPAALHHGFSLSRPHSRHDGWHTGVYTNNGWRFGGRRSGGCTRIGGARRGHAPARGTAFVALARPYRAGGQLRNMR